MSAIRVAAPATTANLGPGYDCLGMALDLWNTIEIQPLPPGAPPSVSLSGEGADELECGPGNLVYRAMEFLYRELDRPIPPLRLHCRNEIPLARGLGSSAAAIAGGLTAANALAAADNDGRPPFAPRDLLEMAATIEGHPDNVAAAVMGGLQLVITDAPDNPDNSDADPDAQAGTLYTVPVNIPPGIHAVLFIPQTRIATDAARAVLPRQIPIADAVHNIARAALFVTALSTNHLEYLPIATQDKLHQALPPAPVSPHETADQSRNGRRRYRRVPIRQRLHHPGPNPRPRDDRSLRNGRSRPPSRRRGQHKNYPTHPPRRPPATLKPHPNQEPTLSGGKQKKSPPPEGEG